MRCILEAAIVRGLKQIQIVAIQGGVAAARKMRGVEYATVEGTRAA